MADRPLHLPTYQKKSHPRNRRTKKNRIKKITQTIRIRNKMNRTRVMTKRKMANQTKKTNKQINQKTKRNKMVSRIARMKIIKKRIKLKRKKKQRRKINKMRIKITIKKTTKMVKINLQKNQKDTCRSVLIQMMSKLNLSS